MSDNRVHHELLTRQELYALEAYREVRERLDPDSRIETFVCAVPVAAEFVHTPELRQRLADRVRQAVTEAGIAVIREGLT